ncbi:PREDICTED: dynein light chain 4, axonemal-like [Polistes dominula]|uniref:Dynein light chain n=1 Tax=Polistes dominula TaxID=743375 RepID=A0ABM1IWB5_POLDO|nr:PREDICTED: dynein light chain 4, axonemal-like [Polistes dominula]
MLAGEVKKEEPQFIFHTYALCKYTDMPEEMKQEVMETCSTAAEKHAEDYEQTARMIKESLDRKFGAPFQVVVGESYACAITHQENTLLYMFTGGNIAILVWRTVSQYK